MYQTGPLYAEKNLRPCYIKDAYMQPFRALASMDGKKILILHPQTQLYLFYQPILQLNLHPNFYFYIQSNKII